MKTKTCRVCKIEFIPAKPLQSVCGYKCALDTAAKKRVKTEKRKDHEARQQLRADKEAIKSRADWIKEAQQAVNAYVRARDKGKPCISCGKPLKDGFHAGHWKPTSSSPELRFNADHNIFGQCIQCNLFFHGNVANYRIGLIERIGLDKVEWLEGNHPPKKYTIPELQAIKAEYKAKLKNILNKYCI